MTIRQQMKTKDMSIYRLAKASQIPYATLNDICNRKVRLERCSAETVYRLAHALDMTMEDLLAPCFWERSSFENFKSALCHRVREAGDIDFLLETLESDDIRAYYERQWYPECLYLLAMVDYLSRENHIPLAAEYEDLRRLRLHKPVYPASVLALAAAGDDTALRRAEETAIPEFRRFNIMESEVRNVV